MKKLKIIKIKNLNRPGEVTYLARMSKKGIVYYVTDKYLATPFNEDVAIKLKNKLKKRTHLQVEILNYTKENNL